MTFKYKHKKTQTSKTQQKEEKRTRSSRERENPRRSEPLPSFCSPSCRLCPGSALVVPPHCSIWKPPHNRNATTMTKTHQELVKKNQKKKKRAEKLEKTSRNMSNPNRKQKIENNQQKPSPKCRERPKPKPEMQAKLETQLEIHAKTQTQTPKPILKHKHSPKSTMKHKHKRRNPYRNRNTNVEMGQQWRLGAWGLGWLRIEEERWLELGRGETYPDSEPPRRRRDKGGKTAERSSALALNGMDSLSAPDLVLFSSFRWVLNVWVFFFFLNVCI